MRARLTALATAALVLLWPAGAGASPGWPHNPKVPAGIGSGPVIALRPHRADLINNRTLVRVVPLPAGAVSLDTVVRAIGDERWASLSGGTATLRAGLLQRPHTELRIGPSVKTLRLADGVAYLAGSSATVTFANVTVVSSNGSGPAPESEHRPYLRYTHGSTVTATGTTFQALGSRSAAHHGVTIGADGTFIAIDTVFRDSGRGLDAYRAARVGLKNVTATGNGGAGIAVNQARVTALTDVTMSGNATGLVLRGPLPVLTLNGTVTSSHNTGTGVDVSNLDSAPLGPLRTDHNDTGILLRECPACVIAGFASTEDGRGVTVERQSTGATVRDGTVNQAGHTGVDVIAGRAALRRVDVSMVSGGTGIRLATSATSSTVDGGTVTGGAVGVSIGTTHASVTGVTVRDSGIGFRVGARADGTLLRQIAATMTGTGLVTEAGPGTVTVAGLRVQQNGGQGVKSNTANLDLDGAQITGATTGLNLKGHARVSNSTVAEAAEAVRAGGHSQVELVKTVLGAHVLGLRIAQSARVTLTDSTVSAPLGARGNVAMAGDTRFPALPMSWLGIFALVALTGAVVLELMRKLRERGHHHDRHVRAPAHVTNTA